MTTFDISKSRNFYKARVGKKFKGGFLSFFTSLAWTLFTISIAAYFYSISKEIAGLPNLSFLVCGFSILYLLFFYFERSYYVPKPELNSENIADSLGAEMIDVVLGSLTISIQNHFTSVEPIILLAALENNDDGKYMLLRAGFGLEKDISSQVAQAVAKIPKQEAQEAKFSQSYIDVIIAARENTLSNQRTEISSGDMLFGLIHRSDVFKNIMFDIKIDENDIRHVVEWHELLKEYSKRFSLPYWDKPVTSGGIGADWSFGYTPMLSQFAKNLNTEVEFLGDIHVYGRHEEINEIERILSKSERNNSLLIGEHGIGKKTIVKGFVARIIKDQILPSLKYAQVFQVDTGALLSGGDTNEIGTRVKKIFNEAVRAGNIILFFDNFHALVSVERGVGQVNTSEIILPYLEGAVRVIGATTLKEFHKNIESSPGVAAAFNRIDVKEPNLEETIDVLEEMIPFVESRDGVFWPYQAVKEVVRVADRFIHNKPNPEKTIELVDEASVSTAKSGGKIVFTKQIDDLVSKKLEVPVAQAEGQEAQKLLNLESFLHKRVIGQDEAIAAVSNAMRRARSGIQNKNRPIGSFLFLGPTGVGKTETAKALAEAYFGSEKSMIRIDMSEFQEESSIYRLIGSPPAAGSEGEKGQLTTTVMDNPFSLVLLDELEKAHPQILTLFLQVFDDGRLTDGTGQTVDFTNTIIISTSNAGSELIRQNLLKNIRGEEMKKSLLDFLQSQGTFRPEFLNRFDAVVAFHPLTPDQIVQVATLMLQSLADQMATKEVTLKVTPAALRKLARAGFDPVYGARPMRRAIQDKVENALAQSLLEGKITRGQTVTIDEKDIN